MLLLRTCYVLTLQACFDPAVRLRMQSQLLSFDKSRGSVDNPAPGRAQDLLV